MTSKSSGGYRPDYAVPPGETILEVIEEMGMTREELAEHMGMPGEVVEGIIEGRWRLRRRRRGRWSGRRGFRRRFGCCGRGFIGKGGEGRMKDEG